MKKKYIGICIPKDIPNEESRFLKTPFYWCKEDIPQMVVENNCIPIFLQYENNLVSDYLDLIDGLILTGDRDIHPKYYGEKIEQIDKEMGLMSDTKMNFQKQILNEILINKIKNIPIIGICAGMQAMNVAMGGTLIKDIASEVGTIVEHRKANRSINEIAHYIDIVDKDSFIYKTIGKEKFGINTNHHQAIKKLANNFKVTAVSTDDRIIEAIEFIGNSFCVGFQWHPESQATDENKMLLKAFFKKCHS